MLASERCSLFFSHGLLKRVSTDHVPEDNLGGCARHVVIRDELAVEGDAGNLVVQTELEREAGDRVGERQ